jgi:feruloyl esterase
MKFMFLDPAPGADWNWRMFNFDVDAKKMESSAKIVNATNPDLRAAKKRGAKIIHYHGWADPGVTAFQSIDYYESVVRKMGQREVDEFYRMFLVPGMFHCGGGVGCGSADWVTAIMDWVEKGTAPGKVIGARVEGGQTKRTRPLCPYPQVARYGGAGSIDAAENFTCVTASPR